MFDLFYLVAYAVMCIYCYANESKDRYDFFYHRSQNKNNSSYKKLLKAMPNGVILLDESNTPMFYNQLVHNIITKRTQRATVTSPNFDDENQRKEAKAVAANETL